MEKQNEINFPVKTKIATIINLVVSPFVFISLLQYVNFALDVLNGKGFFLFEWEREFAIFMSFGVFSFLIALPIFLFLNLICIYKKSGLWESGILLSFTLFGGLFFVGNFTFLILLLSAVIFFGFLLFAADRKNYFAVVERSKNKVGKG